MIINTQFNASMTFQLRSFAPMPPLSRGGLLINPMESSMFSSSAKLLMMMNAFKTMTQEFQSGAMLPAQANFGPRGPLSCFLGPQPGWRRRPGRGKVSSPQSKAVEAAPPRPGSRSGGASVQPIVQSNSVSCGQTSVAMAVNSLTGKHLTDRDINRKHGFGLLKALNSESRGSGYKWRDAGNFQAKNWPTLEKKLNGEKTPVIIGLNGPNFSRSGRGHIITLLSVEGNKVKYADPADGKIKYTTKQAIQSAPPHPNGKFFMIASRA